MIIAIVGCRSTRARGTVTVSRCLSGEITSSTVFERIRGGCQVKSRCRCSLSAASPPAAPSLSMTVEFLGTREIRVENEEKRFSDSDFPSMTLMTVLGERQGDAAAAGAQNPEHLPAREEDLVLVVGSGCQSDHSWVYYYVITTTGNDNYCLCGSSSSPGSRGTKGK